MESLKKTTANVPAIESTRLSAEDMRAVDKVREIVTAKMCECPRIAELARMTSTSASKLQADFKTATGMTIHDYVCEERMKHAREWSMIFPAYPSPTAASMLP
jgi:transcriptional regulator GlxA family with amidase domain